MLRIQTSIPVRTIQRNAEDNIHQLFSRDLAGDKDYLRQDNKILHSKLGCASTKFGSPQTWD